MQPSQVSDVIMLSLSKLGRLVDSEHCGPDLTMSGFKIGSNDTLHYAVAKPIYHIFILFSLRKIRQKNPQTSSLTVAFNSAMSKASVIPTIMFYYSGEKKNTIN